MSLLFMSEMMRCFASSPRAEVPGRETASVRQGLKFPIMCIYTCICVYIYIYGLILINMDCGCLTHQPKFKLRSWAPWASWASCPNGPHGPRKLASCPNGLHGPYGSMGPWAHWPHGYGTTASTAAQPSQRPLRRPGPWACTP